MAACILMTSSPASALPNAELPSPIWQYQLDEILNYNLSMRQVGSELYLKNAGIDTPRIAILDDKTGKEKALFPTHYQAYTDWGYMTEVGSNGNIYSLYTDNGAYKLRATNPKGKILWGKTFPEKVNAYAGISGLYLLDNGNLLVYNRVTNQSQSFILYQYDANGKLIKQKHLNEFVHDYRNGYLVTLASAGKSLTRVSFYDANLNRKYTLTMNPQQNEFRGLSSDGTVYFVSYDQEKKKTTVIARNLKGTQLWSQTVSGVAGRDNYYEVNGAGKYFLIQIGNALYLYNRQGLVTKKAFEGPFSYQIGSDQSVLVREEGKLTLLTDLLKALNTIHIESLPRTQEIKYFGNGEIYTYDWEENVLSKIDLKRKG